MHKEPAHDDLVWSHLPASADQPAPIVRADVSPPDLVAHPPAWVPLTCPVETSSDNDIARRLQQLFEANETLERELSLHDERLSVVLEFSEQATISNDPTALERVLFTRYAAIVGADALFFEDGGVCTMCNIPGPAAIGEINPDRLRVAIGPEIAELRRSRHPIRIDAAAAAKRGLGEIHVLLGALVTDQERLRVLIAIRGDYREQFDHDDEISSDTVLVYGGHILRNLLMVHRLQQTSLEAVGSLANAIEARDTYTGGHSERVGWLAVLTGKTLGLSSVELQMIEWAGLLHDIGKIGIPEHILNKPGQLTAAELDVIRRHPRLGFEVLSPLSNLKPVLDAVLYHHENHDGSGYPTGLRGERIPVLARILHVVDIFDAVTSTRSYRDGLSTEQAFRLLREGAGTVTDPVVTEAFIAELRQSMLVTPDGFRHRFAHLCPPDSACRADTRTEETK